MEIVNYAENAPRGTIWHLKQAIKWLNPADLEELSYVVLFDDMPEVTEDTPEDIKRNLELGLLCPGQYIPRKGDDPPYIMLFLKVIYRPIPAIYFLSPMTTIRLTDQIAHGVAYHVLATRKGKYTAGEEFVENEEDEWFVEKYVSSVIKKLQSRWYYRFGQWLSRDLAERYYIFGIQDWKAKHYDKAAENWRKARMLNPNHENATQWYWHAKEMLDNKLNRA
jgi:hypothetical protein